MNNTTTHDFGEKINEYSPKFGDYVPVVLTAKYKDAKAKAIELIDSGKYNLSDADFWILRNGDKKGTQMYYTGLIISHNGCLKINNVIEQTFNPDSVSIDKDGYNSSLVYTYCNAEQGIYEVGEVNIKNCKNDYPYAMAFKRLFDRVVLKLSKIAYSGIYSESESDEFKKQYDTPQPKEETPTVENPTADEMKNQNKVLIGNIVSVTGLSEDEVKSEVLKRAGGKDVKAVYNALGKWLVELNNNV